MKFGRGVKTDTLDTREFFEKLDLLDDRVRKTIKSELKKNARHLEGEAKAVAPVKVGTLQGGIQANPKVIENAILGEFESQVHAGTGQSASYALRVHETMKPHGTEEMERGALTKQRPPSAVGPAGGGYLTRPLLHFSKFYQEQVAKGLRKLK